MNRFEMFLKLLENPKRIGVDINNNNNKVYFNGDFFKWERSGDIVMAFIDRDETWEIIEPPKKLREMDFGEAYWRYLHVEYVNPSNLKSVVSGDNWERRTTDIQKEEYMGKWTVEGVYEDEPI